MNAEKFRLRAGFDAVHVPYKGPPEGLQDIMGNRIDFMFAPIVSAISLIKDGRVVAIAVSSASRSSVLPDVPTTEEAGYPGTAYRFWVGMLAPAGAPPPPGARLNKKDNPAPATAEIQSPPAPPRPRGAPTAPGCSHTPIPHRV